MAHPVSRRDRLPDEIPVRWWVWLLYLGKVGEKLLKTAVRSSAFFEGRVSFEMRLHDFGELSHIDLTWRTVDVWTGRFLSRLQGFLACKLGKNELPGIFISEGRVINGAQADEQHFVEMLRSSVFVEMRIPGFNLKQVYAMLHYIYVVRM